MTFLWPAMLWLGVLLPLAIAGYLLVQRRKKARAQRYARFALPRDGQGAPSRLRRHLPPFLMLLALAMMIIAIARPASVISLPYQYETVILAIDASGSMRAADVAPTRIAAARAAARSFLAAQPRDTRIGVVSFAATASVVQAPTLNRDDIVAALDRIQLQRGTAIGSAILVSLKLIFPDVEFDLRAANPRPGGAREAQRGGSLDSPANAAGNADPGSFKSAAIVLLSDGQTTAGPDPIEAAKMASERGVRVFTVGVGTLGGEVLAAEGWSMRVRLDESALKTIAETTKAEYFHAGTATDLSGIYQALTARLVFEKRATEITALFAAAAAVLALVSGALSLLWFNRIL
ncbi:MAG TPA: VWA domain-containing protein [Casimicrobiaceae bacterium]|jgi:Ca-activated chloride channel family protein